MKKKARINSNIIKLAGQYLSIILILLTLFSAAFAAENKYVGSKESNKYHQSSCKWVKKIKKENIIQFKTVQEAEDAGYKPCGTCKPRSNKISKRKTHKK